MKRLAIFLVLLLLPFSVPSYPVYASSETDSADRVDGVLAYSSTAKIMTAAAPKKAVKKLAMNVTVPVDILLGQSYAYINGVYGAPGRTESSEYSFSWSIYNRNYKNFFMVGYDNGSAVALYTNSANLSYQGITVNNDRNAVRKNFGAPLTSLSQGNMVLLIPNKDQKDVYLLNGYYVTFFYDLTSKYKVISIMAVKQDYEEALIGKALSFDEDQIRGYERISFELANAARGRQGKTALKWDDKAAAFADTRSADMRDRNYFDHYTPEGKSPLALAKTFGLKVKGMCENIAFGHRNPILAHEAFMNSKGHRSNILYSNKYLGTGVVTGGSRFILLTQTYTR